MEKFSIVAIRRVGSYAQADNLAREIFATRPEVSHLILRDGAGISGIRHIWQRESLKMQNSE